jgi:hypothetical protein
LVCDFNPDRVGTVSLPHCKETEIFLYFPWKFNNSVIQDVLLAVGKRRKI